MNKEFIRMQKLAGILTEGVDPKYVPGSNPDIDDKSADMALSMMTKEGTSSRMTKEELKRKIKQMMTSGDPYKDFPNDIDWQVVGRDMDGLSLEGYSETTNKYYTGAIEGSYDPDTDPEPEFSNSDLLFIEEIPFHHLNRQQQHSLGMNNVSEVTPEDIATKEKSSVDEASYEASERMDGLAPVSAKGSFVSAARMIISALKRDGFEEEDIHDYLLDLITTLPMEEDLFEAKGDEETDTEDVIVAKDEVPAEEAPAEDVTDTTVDIDMDGTPDIDAGSSESKAAFNKLTDAYRAAKELGDQKLIRQLANTITYFNKNIILDTNTVG